MRRVISQTASTKRNPATVGGQGAATTHLTGIKVSKPVPAGKAVLERAGTEAPTIPYEMYTDDENDILRGDILVYNGKEYPVKWSDSWEAVYVGGGQAGVKVLLVEALNPRQAP